MAAYNSAVDVLKAGRLTDAEFAKVLEDTVLPEWIAGRQRMEALENVHVRNRTTWTRLLEYMQARESAWSLLVQGSRHQDTKLLHQATEELQRAENLAKRLND